MAKKSLPPNVHEISFPSGKGYATLNLVTQNGIIPLQPSQKCKSHPEKEKKSEK